MKTRNRILALHIFAAVALACAFYVSPGCALMKSDTRAAALTALEADALAVIDRSAVSVLQSYAATGKLDSSALAGALGQVTSTGAIQKVVLDSGGTPELALAAETAAKAAIARGASPQKAARGVAAAIKTAKKKA